MVSLGYSSFQLGDFWSTRYHNSALGNFFHFVAGPTCDRLLFRSVGNGKFAQGTSPFFSHRSLGYSYISDDLVCSSLIRAYQIWGGWLMESRTSIHFLSQLQNLMKQIGKAKFIHTHTLSPSQGNCKMGEALDSAVNKIWAFLVNRQQVHLWCGCGKGR